MSRLALCADRLRLTCELWLHRHGACWPLLAVSVGLLLTGAAIFLPKLDQERAEKHALLADLQARALASKALSQLPTSASASRYEEFQATLAKDDEILSTLKAILDAAASHHLLCTRAEYQHAHAANVQAETLQMTVPVKGRYNDIRRWLEEVLRRHAFLAVDELAFKREDIGASQIEAKVRLTLWLRSVNGHDLASPPR